MHSVCVGLSFGDEGKGRIVDFLCSSGEYDAVVRFQGGGNAGHTLYHDNNKIVLHHLPSGILHPNLWCVLGNGMVIEPVKLLEEIESIKKQGFSVDKLRISDIAHVVIPEYKEEDQANTKTIGTTGRGIGPAYTAKVGRKGIRIRDILEDFPALKQYTIDTVEFLYELAYANKKFLFEGAQGTFLDVDHGTYPFVTSSNTTAGAACTGSGVPPNAIKDVIGVFKAYSTRVGNGPFTTELLDDTGEAIRQAGKEFGATTGRPRRCGWLDLQMLRRSIILNGVTELIMTKLDVLSGFETIKFLDTSGRYQEFEGFTEDISHIRDVEDLPGTVKDYILSISYELERSKVPATFSYVSVGSHRDAIIPIGHKRKAAF